MSKLQWEKLQLMSDHIMTVINNNLRLNANMAGHSATARGRQGGKDKYNMSLNPECERRQ